jgi:hypothetical protein
MKTFKQHVAEKYDGDGDCFATANRLGIAMGYDIIHALVWGQGPLAGKRFPHAWCEHKGKAIDKSNGNDVNINKRVYYAIGQIDPKERGAFVRYTPDEARRMMAKHLHHGPWDLDPSLEV